MIGLVVHEEDVRVPLRHSTTWHRVAATGWNEKRTFDAGPTMSERSLF